MLFRPNRAFIPPILFGFALPVLLYAAYFAAVGLRDGLGWSPHLWIGTVVFAGVVGWLASYLMLPPRLDDA